MELDAHSLGNSLYPHIVTLVGDALAPKITGMLLEGMALTDLAGLLENHEALKETVMAAVNVLPPEMLELLGCSHIDESAYLPPSPAAAGPSPTSIMAPQDSWADCEEDEDPLPSVDDLFASAERKRISRVEGAAEPEAMETDDGFVCEWDAAQISALEPEALCAFIAERLREPQVRIMRAVVELLGSAVATGLLRETERCLFHGGMIVEETGKPRTPGGIYLKLLKDSESLPAEAQQATLLRIKKEGADAKKAQQKALAAKRNTPGMKAGKAYEVESPTAERAKPSLADFMTPMMRAK